MRLKWYAHACLRIEGEGVSIITDPYTPEKSGFEYVNETADIVVRSSDDDSAHANAAMIPGDPEIVTATHILSFEESSGTGDSSLVSEAAGNTASTRAGVQFTAIPAMESMRVKLQPRDNAMYKFVVDGIQIVHFGDVGNRLEAWQLNRMGEVDIAIVPTGGPPTIELKDLHDALDVLRPAVTVPMHYALPGCKFPQMADVRDFTRRYETGQLKWAEEPVVEVTKAGLPENPEVWVLQATTARGGA